MLPEHLKPNAILRGPLFPEPVQVVAALHLGGNVKLNGYGLKTGQAFMVTFPDPETGQVKCLFTKRNVQTIPFDLNPDEYDFYSELTKFVEDQSIKAASEDMGRTPREDLREGRPMDASEFAVHLDHIRDGRAPVDYQDPKRFFERTVLTQNLLGLRELGLD